MIAKPASTHDLPKDPRYRAGAKAERQMAHYLHRAFAKDRHLHVLNDLRLVDPEQPEHDGSPGVSQIDHLVVHRCGVFIIESKSVRDEVRVRSDGTGGDEWERKYRGGWEAFPSPIQQAKRQGEFLREFLDCRAATLRDRDPVGLRTLGKLVRGSDQRGFRSMPVQIVIAISDGGKITRVNRWKEPTAPFRVFVSKADLAPEKIKEEHKLHRAANNPLKKEQGEYGIWALTGSELDRVVSLLAQSDTPRASEAPARGATRVESARTAPAPKARTSPNGHHNPACKSCGGVRLDARWGKYGYYWKCEACDANTAMRAVCGACGATARRGDGTVRIRKEGASYFRCCEACGMEERIWTAQAAS